MTSLSTNGSAAERADVWTPPSAKERWAIIRGTKSVAMAASPTDGGYWLVAADGGLFAFGDAGFFGSMGSVRLNRPVSAVVPGDAGYLMVGEDGGAFSFGDVAFFGSLADHPPATPVVSVALKA